MGDKDLSKLINKKIIVLIIFFGAGVIGYATGNVIAQEVNIGSNGGTPKVSFEDALNSGMYEIRLNDGTGEFQIYDITNSRNAIIVAPTGHIGVSDAATINDDFTIGCSNGNCNIKTLALNGTAQNTVRSNGGDGDARFVLRDTTSSGIVRFQITTQDDGSVCMGDPSGELCMLQFHVKGANQGQVTQANGACIANCP